jgi:Rrf2 family protein
MWSQKLRYSIRVLTVLAMHGSRCIPARELAAENGVPVKYLEKILLDLRNAGLVRSVKGAAGGYTLVDDPTTLHLSTVVEALEPELLRGSDGGLPAMRGGDTDVAVEEPLLGAISSDLRRRLAAVTIADTLMRWQQTRSALNYAI